MGSTCLVQPFSGALRLIADLLLVSSDDQVKAYIKKIMLQLNKWMLNGKISKLVVVITNKDTGANVERWQFDVQIFNKSNKSGSTQRAVDKENATSG